MYVSSWRSCLPSFQDRGCTWQQLTALPAAQDTPRSLTSSARRNPTTLSSILVPPNWCVQLARGVCTAGAKHTHCQPGEASASWGGERDSAPITERAPAQPGRCTSCCTQTAPAAGERERRRLASLCREFDPGGTRCSPCPPDDRGCRSVGGTSISDPASSESGNVRIGRATAGELLKGRAHATATRHGVCGVVAFRVGPRTFPPAEARPHVRIGLS
jgi:hypothetical protein